MGLLSKSWAVWRAALKMEKERPQISRKEEELEFLPAAIEVLETPASPLGRTFAILIAVILAVAILWAWFGHIDTVAVAQGKIIPGGRVKVIQSLDAGVVRAIKVEEGRQVKEGQILIELDPTDTVADAARLTRELATARLDTARLEALITAPTDPLPHFKPPADSPSAMVAGARALMLAQSEEQKQKLSTFDSAIRQRRAELKTSQARIAKFRDTLPLLKERVDAFAYLARKEYASKLRLKELEEQLVARRRDLVIEQSRILETKEAVGVLQRRRAEQIGAFVAKNNTDLAEALRKAAGLEHELTKAKERRRRQILRSPVEGTVQQLTVNTIGGVVQPAEDLMVIVPKGSRLEVEALVLNKDIGFVTEGQDAALKVESFPFTKFGLIPGKVKHLSADAVQDENLGLVFPARIEMLENRILVGSRWVQLAPGMSVTAEVKTGKRRAIEFFLSPLMKYQDEALRER